MSAQTYCPNCDIVYPMAHECCPLCMLKQVSGELCDKCGWAMRFPQEPCRCELEAENTKLRKLAYFGEHHFPDLTWKVRCEELLKENKELRKLLRYFFGNGSGIPYAQWTSEQHAAYDILQKG